MNWLLRVLRRDRLDRDLDRELRFHVEEETRRLAGRVGNSVEARRRALAAFGGLEVMREATRDVRGARWIADLGQDLQFAGRMMRKSPAFAATAALSLAIGIGANAAIFSVTDALLRRPLPVAAPNELAFLNIAGDPQPNYRFSYPAIERLCASVPEASFAAMTSAVRFQAALQDGASLVVGQLVTGNWFSLLGVHASAGRLITPDDTRALGGQPVVVLSHAFWDSQFGRDPHVVGSPITMNGVRLTVVGVAAEGFTGLTVGETVDAWMPVTMQAPLAFRGNASISDADGTKPWLPQDGIAWLTVEARIPATQVAQRDQKDQRETTGAHILAVERAEIERLAAGADDPSERADILRHHIELIPGALGLSTLRGTFSSSLTVLSATVAIVLLIACANLASVVLARSAARSREFALRLSVGARRERLIRQILTETLTLAAIGGTIGVGVAVWGARMLLRMASSGPSPIPLDVALNWRLVAFSVMVSLVTGLLFGLGPALRLSRTDVHEVLKPGGRVVGSQGAGAMALSRGLVVGQVALSLMLLIGAALFVRTLGNLLASDLGFDRTTVVGARFDPVLAAIPRGQWPDLGRRLVEAARTLPGVTGVTLALNGPYSSSQRVSNIQIDGEAPRPGRDADVREEYVGPNYFATVGMPLLAGRDLSGADDLVHPLVAIVNEAMARHFFGTTSPVGKRFGYGAPATTEIVGVVRDARLDGVRQPVPPMVFYPLSQAPGEVVRHLYVRVTVAAARAGGLPAALRSAIRTADPRLAVWDIATLDQLVDRSLTTSRLVSQLTALFGLLAVAVACLGLYGTLSYSVARRTNEIGVRLALGAAPSAVRWLVLRDAVWLVLVGCAVGLVAAFLGLTSVGALLYGLSPRDPVTFAGATAILFAVSALAAAVPAWRASRVDPLVALRE